jgi:Gram-negative bacterial TonB protein C-terminal
MVVLSDTGYVCSTHVLRGISKEINKKAETAVRGWHFEPAQKNGYAVPVAIAVDANYWTNSAGEVVSDPPQSAASSEKVGNTPVR